MRTSIGIVSVLFLLTIRLSQQDTWCNWGVRCGRCSRTGFSIRHVKSERYLVAASKTALAAQKKMPQDESGLWLYDTEQHFVMNKMYADSVLAIERPIIFERMTKVILVNRREEFEKKLNLSFSTPGIMGRTTRNANIVGFIVDRDMHWVKYGDQIKSAVYGLNYDEFMKETVLMPIVHDSFYAVCMTGLDGQSEDCDCMRPPDPDMY